MEYDDLLKAIKMDNEHSNFHLKTTTAHIFKNDKILLITKPKIAHSWGRDTFLNQQSADFDYFDSNFSINCVDLSLTKNYQAVDTKLYNDYFESITEIWNSFLQKNEKRDLIILYRNPLENWLSAFVQDYIEPLVPNQDINSPYFTKFIREIPKIPYGQLQDFIFDCEHSNSYNKSFTEKYKTIMYNIYKIHMDVHVKNREFTWGHYYPWMTFVYKLVNTDLIDKSKIKIVDTYDAPLEEQLHPYFDTPKKAGPTKKHNHTFELLYDVLNNSTYKQSILEYLKDEINIYYDLKENYKSFHLNK